MSNIIIPVVFAESRTISIKSSKVIFLYAIDRIKAYTTAIQEASVAVKTPATIPPTHINNIKRAGIDSNTIFTISLNGGRACPTYPLFLAIIYPTTIHPIPQSIPGRYPARKRAATEVPPEISE
jgi:hypothetical protein